MKRITYFILSILTLFALPACGKFHGTNQSVWSDFMWVLPLLPFVGGVLLIRAGIKSHRSGWEQQTNRGYIGGKERLPLWKNPLFIGGCILILATAVIIWGVNYEK